MASGIDHFGVMETVKSSYLVQDSFDIQIHRFLTSDCPMVVDGCLETGQRSDTDD